MPRYGPAPGDEAPPQPPDNSSSLTRWSVRRKVLAVVAGVGMVGAFVFNFLSPTSSGIKKISTTTSVPAPTTTSSVTTTSTSTTTSTPTTIAALPRTTTPPR
jgi:hypothetical protein